MLKNKLIDDVFLRAVQAAPSDDSEISKTQIAYWASQILPQLIKAECDREINNGRPIPSLYITREDCEALAIEDLECQGECVDGIYFDLSADIIDLVNNKGLVRLVTDEGDQVKLVSLETIDILRQLKFSKPSMSNPLAYKVGARRVNVEGFSHSEVAFDFITTYYVKKQDIEALSDTGEVVVSSLTAPILIDTLAEMLKQQMYGSSPDQANDGVDVKQPAYHRMIGSQNTNIQPPE
jgi:hypothetical protein